MLISLLARLSQYRIELLSKIFVVGELRYLGSELSRTLQVNATTFPVKSDIGKVILQKNLSL